MRIEIGVPGSGTTVVLDVLDHDPAAVKRSVVEALETLKLAGDTWVEWSRENETPEQAEMREIVEKNGVLKKRALMQENSQLEALLEGRTDGIRAGEM